MAAAAKATGVFYRIKDSAPYSLYLFLFYHDDFIRRKPERDFYRNAIGKHAGLIFDIGANQGTKAIIFAPLARQVVCVEPSPQVVSSLQERFRHQPKVVVVPKGVGATSRTEKFFLFDNNSALNTFVKTWVDQLRSRELWGQSASAPMPQEIEVPIVTLDSLIEEYGLPRYIKIDVEGFEKEVLAGLSRQVPLISFECNLPTFSAETIECLAMLAKLSPSMHFNYCVDEPPARFHSEHWHSHAEMTEIVRRYDGIYMEIWGRTSKPDDDDMGPRA